MSNCGLCRGNVLRPIYVPKGSLRGVVIHVCEECGLVQSLPRDVPGDKVRRVTYDASFGNVRYGKSFSAIPAVQFIMKHHKGKIDRVLDVGASDLSFIKVFLSTVQNEVYVDGLEPDEQLVKGWGKLPDGVRAVSGPIESFPLTSTYDLIHCSHTLEHLKDPLSVLHNLRKMISRNGALYVEVPNLATIMSEDIVEEWFLDKHLYHFNVVSLVSMMSATGFYVYQIKGGENVCLLAEPTREKAIGNWSGELEWVLKAVDTYANQLIINQSAMSEVVEKINQYLGKVAVWGAGRIFDLMLHLGLDTDVFVTDTYLERDDVQVHLPEEVVAYVPELIVIASRVYHDEIKEQAKLMAPYAKVIGWKELCQK